MKFISRKTWGVVVGLVIIAVIVVGVIMFSPNQPSSEVAELVKINNTRELTASEIGDLAEIKVLLSANINDDQGLLMLAMLKQTLGDHDGAIELYEILHGFRPDEITPLQNMATIYFDTGKYELAEELQLKILDINYKWANSYRELMSIYRYHLKDRREKIEPLLLYGYENFPEAKQDMISQLALYYDIFAEDYTKALRYYNELLPYVPNDTEVLQRIQELKNLK